MTFEFFRILAVFLVLVLAYRAQLASLVLGSISDHPLRLMHSVVAKCIRYRRVSISK